MTTAPISPFWWLRRRSYFVFVLRELSSVFVAWFVVYLLFLVTAVSSGTAEYERFLNWSAGPWVLALNAITLVFVLLHAVTWFNLAPKAIAVRLGGKRVPALLIAGPNYAAWLVASAVVAWLILRG